MDVFTDAHPSWEEGDINEPDYLSRLLSVFSSCGNKWPSPPLQTRSPTDPHAIETGVLKSLKHAVPNTCALGQGREYTSALAYLVKWPSPLKRGEVPQRRMWQLDSGLSLLMPLELLHDDIHDTGQSLCKQAKLVIQRGWLREQTYTMFFYLLPDLKWRIEAIPHLESVRWQRNLSEVHITLYFPGIVQLTFTDSRDENWKGLLPSCAQSLKFKCDRKII